MHVLMFMRKNINNFNLIFEGNNQISQISSYKTYDLRFDMKDKQLATCYAVYNNFVVQPAALDFPVSFSGYTGSCGE